jgi:polyhydroxyalkanoate synthesis regulator phasin
MQIFGFEIKRSEKDKEASASFAEPLNDDGALTVGGALGGAYGMLLDIEGSAKTEAELVTRYRSMALTPEVQQAVDEVVNEAISVSSHERTVEIVLDDVELPNKVKKKIEEEFDNILRLLDFSNTAYETFSKFYVDGRLNYHVIIDEKNLSKGIKELRYLDPRKIRFIREMESVPLKGSFQNVTTKSIKNEYYMYSESGFGNNNTQRSSFADQNIAGLKIAKDSIVRVTSGLVNETNSVVLSHLHKAIKPLNQLKMLEDANVVYTLTRAPERRVFYVDVGNLPKAKAEQYLHDMMARHKNKVVYDPTTGEIKDDRKMMTMTEDYWFPRREGNRTTEVDTLPSSGTLSDNESLMYFQTKLYKAMNVPVARLQPETMYTFGRTSEITREELKFAKFIQRVRNRFSILFDRCLEKQLILKGVITPDEWKEIQDKLRYDFMKDNYFEQLKEAEILREKISTLRDIEDHVGKYFSRNWIRKHVLFMSDSEIEEMEKEIAAEKAAGEYDDGLDTPPDNLEPDSSGQDLEEPGQNTQQPDEYEDDTAEESLLINNTNSFKSYKRGIK